MVKDRIELSLTAAQALATMNAVADATWKIDEMRQDLQNKHKDNPALLELLDKPLVRKCAILEEVGWKLRYELDKTEEDDGDE